MKRRRAHAALIGAGTAFGMLLALSVTTAGGVESAAVEAPAPPAVLQRVAARNERASALAAAEVRASAQANLQLADAEFSRRGNAAD